MTDCRSLCQQIHSVGCLPPRSLIFVYKIEKCNSAHISHTLTRHHHPKVNIMREFTRVDIR